jgi:hypothetical protein
VIPGARSHVERHRRALADFFRTQRDASLTGIDPDEWNDLLAEVYAREATRTATVFGREVARRFGETFDPAFIENYIAEYARISAESTNETTAEHLRESDDPSAVWALAIGTRAGQIAISKVTTEANFGRGEAARQAGRRAKRWVVTSNNPRSTHAMLNGESVAIGATFSNGAKWPGDPMLPLDERANCSCLLEF